MEALTPLGAAIPCRGEADLGAVLEAARACAGRTGLVHEVAERLDAAVRGMALTAVGHAGSGEILLAPVRAPWGLALDVIAIGKSFTAGAVSSESRPAWADQHARAVFAAGALGRESPGLTVTAARLYAAGAPTAAPAWDVAAFVRPYPGHSASGDAVLLLARPRGIRVAVIDALGHGESAARCAERLAAHIAAANPRAGVRETIAAAHAARAADPRGAALSLLDLDDATGAGEFGGVGNVDAVAWFEATRPTSRPGTVGVALPSLAVESVTVPPRAGLALYSDGLKLRWPSFATAGFEALSAAILLGVILATAERKVDDASVLVLRRTP